MTYSYFSKHRPSGPMLSISRFVCPSVRLSVCLCVCSQKKVFFPSLFSLLRYRLTVFLPPLPEVRCPIFLEIRNPSGKVMERSGLIFEHFCLKVVKNRRAKKSFFSLTFFTFEVPFNGLFAPTSRSWMSNIFRDLESLGKSNGKKWTHVHIFVQKWSKVAARKKSFFLLILPWSTLLWHRCYYPHRSRDALYPVCGIFSTYYVYHQDIDYFNYLLQKELFSSWSYMVEVAVPA